VRGVALGGSLRRRWMCGCCYARGCTSGLENYEYRGVVVATPVECVDVACACLSSSTAADDANSSCTLARTGRDSPAIPTRRIAYLQLRVTTVQQVCFHIFSSGVKRSYKHAMVFDRVTWRTRCVVLRGRCGSINPEAGMPHSTVDH
jgi:hypothetical protein